MRKVATLPPTTVTGISAPRAPAKLGYFQQALPTNIILLTFLVVTLPLVAISLVSLHDNIPIWNILIWVYVWLFGMTHFVITLTVYLQSQNLKHFASTWRNRLYFFAVPVVVFVGFALLHAFQVGARFGLFAILFWSAIRLLDFNHFNRQSFGVFQLYKGRTGVKFPLWVKRCENLFFCSMTLLLFVTFLSGGLCPLFQPGGWLTISPIESVFKSPEFPLEIQQLAGRIGLDVSKEAVLNGLQAACVVALFITVGLLIAAVVGLVRSWWTAGRPDGLTPALLYFAFQTLSALFAVLSFPLYIAALAIHYVEYHVLMIPRCFHTPLDEGSRLDRAFGTLRSHRGFFYATVIAVAGLVTAAFMTGMGAAMGNDRTFVAEPFNYLLLIAVFDGLFVFHYFIEMLIWRFSDPFFRKSLVGLYFAPKR